ncbi:MAG: ribosome-associated translation inhibitor RaiA [Bacteroidetes bacterium]|nr:ribosome-associated translation inhibitor RaiA [Bacteroidota bacterium]
MQINIKATNMELTEAIRGYVNEKIGSLDRFFDESAFAYVEVGRESNHHQKGEDVFIAEVNIAFSGSNFFSRVRNADLYAAIDEVKEELHREISKNKDRKQTLFVRGARSLKKRIKGIKPWWPFGGKS